MRLLVVNISLPVVMNTTIRYLITNYYNSSLALYELEATGLIVSYYTIRTKRHYGCNIIAEHKANNKIGKVKY